MPVGIMIDTISIATGGMIGAAVGEKISGDFKEKLNMIFGVRAMGMGLAPFG